ncbi:hypothetical protein RchiOBHm_Chr7g0220061 [Rosa chinensis]|uniref:Uncharacterized protein n=1 Tax=Rosa chinensis TaxID=74649 RepID=A0A2P6PCQ4_ROSCH|nr:hypothetical protein RchiOBHm_Chr7g0220061 [Rosa chinensis]
MEAPDSEEEIRSFWTGLVELRLAFNLGYGWSISPTVQNDFLGEEAFSSPWVLALWRRLRFCQ